MKSKYPAAIILLVATITIASLGGSQATSDKVYLLKSGGKTLAELRVKSSATVSVEGTGSAAHTEYDHDTGRLVATGGAILKLTSGTNSISARADEIESIP